MINSKGRSTTSTNSQLGTFVPDSRARPVEKIQTRKGNLPNINFADCVNEQADRRLKTAARFGQPISEDNWAFWSLFFISCVGLLEFPVWESSYFLCGIARISCVGLLVFPVWDCSYFLCGIARISCVGLLVFPVWDCSNFLCGIARISCVGLLVFPVWDCSYFLCGIARISCVGLLVFPVWDCSYFPLIPAPNCPPPPPPPAPPSWRGCTVLYTVNSSERFSEIYRWIDAWRVQRLYQKPITCIRSETLNTHSKITILIFIKINSAKHTGPGWSSLVVLFPSFSNSQNPDELR
jgi:hypothetical protein